MSEAGRKAFNKAVLLASMAVITFFSLSSGVKTPVPAYLLHFAAYFSLASLLLLVFHDTRYSHLEAFIGAFIFGSMIELVQASVPVRSFSVFDLSVNFAGSLVVLVEARVPVVHRVVELEEEVFSRVLPGSGL